MDAVSVHLHKFWGELQFHFCVIISSQLQNADSWEFAAPENSEVVSGRRNFKTAARSVGRQTLRKQLVSGSRKKKGAIGVRQASSHSNKIFKTNHSVVVKTFLQTFVINHVEQFSVPTCCGSFWKSYREVPVVDDVVSSHEQELYPTTSLDENCIEFNFQTDRSFYVDLRRTYLVVKLKLVRGCGYETYNSKEIREGHKKKAKVDEEETAEKAPVPLVTQVNNILHSISSNVVVYINNQQNYNSNGPYAHKFHISNKFRGAIFEYNGVLHCEVYDDEVIPDEITDAPLSEPFFTKRMKMLSRPDGLILYGKLGVKFFSTSG